MKLEKKLAYLNGLFEGLGLDDSTKEGKALLAMKDVLDEICESIQELDDDMDQVYDELDAIDEDMDDLEDLLFGDEDEDDDDEEYEDDEDEDGDEEYYEITCPNCGTSIGVNEETLFNEDICCPNCGAGFDIEFRAPDEEEEEVIEAEEAKDEE